VRDSYGEKCKTLRPGLKCEDGHYCLGPTELLLP
jgi:hypothetical protein